MPNAAGLYKQLAYKVETTFGTLPAAASAQALRRVQSTLDLTKDTFQSAEIRNDLQVSDFRHGVRRVKGPIIGELSCATYKDFMAAAFKRDFAAITPITAAAVTIGAPTGNIYPLTLGSGNLLTGGYKVGMVVRLSVGSLNAANISKNLLITAISSATACSVMPINGSTLVAEGPIAECTVTATGKYTYIPSTGHTDKSFSIEHWHSDVALSEIYLGCKVNKISLNMPPTGMATIELDFMGQDMTSAGEQYFTSPTAATTTGALASVNGVVRLNDATVAIVTGLSFSVIPTFTGDPVVGSTVLPSLFPGTVNVTGQATAYFADATLRDVFINETEVDLYVVYTADNTAAADFMAFALPRIKLGGAGKNDGQGGLVQTLPFRALYNKNGGAGIATEATTISVQDAQA